MLRNLVLLATIAILLGGSILLPTLRRSPRAAQELPQSLYVWQRDWSDPVRESLAQAGEVAESLVVLVAEVAWDGGDFMVARVRPDYAALAKTGVPQWNPAAAVAGASALFRTGRTADLKALVARLTKDDLVKHPEIAEMAR